MTDASLTTKLNRPYIQPNGGSQELVGEVTVDPGLQTSQPDLQIAVLVDRSGSMSGDRIETAREGAKRALGYLDDDDVLTVIGFNSSADVALEATRFGDAERDDVESATDDLTAGGGTDIHGGLELATEELRDLPEDDDTVRRILLLSDGVDNVRGPDDFERQARDIDEHGIRIRAAGIGDEYDEETIRTLGSTSRGQWSHIEEPGEIQEFFGEALDDAETVVGTDAELRMNIADGVEFTEVYRAQPQVQEVDVEYEGTNEAVVKLPDLQERETQKVLMKIRAPGRDSETDLTLADVHLDAGNKSAEGEIELGYTTDGDLLGIEHKEVSVELDKTRVRKDLGEGDVESAETRVDKMKDKHGESAEIDELEEGVTRVAEGGRAEQEKQTKVKSDDDKV